ncbi:DNA internalization-related competence protein ComEC/Rec2 [Oleiagrimonas sp. C23AA]|uniref:DNA internalization-related competence protein ComEC/Rec2 n=1 Tax=Oleiagrimonas sp. C23AA TaxID=2719047 RepID=UPI00141EDB8C|nr:DNA internalization-related competence protein ComEC/Rec2 [Oleiagrimonas sp. C23AA]NII09646.1 DNA internalization-related competence protein ComEC/Rec2 [Oleiagrimonas sp. C23AA]
MEAWHTANARALSLNTVAVAVMAGCALVMLCPQLPSPRWCWLAALPALLAARRWPCMWLLVAFVLAAAWGIAQGRASMRARLPYALEGRDISVVGQVKGLPRHRSDMESFRFHIQSASFHGKALPLRGMVHLAWYRASQAVTACSHWQFRVRLKRPRGLSDPGVFDSERYALQHREVAVGYVRPQGPHRLLANPLCMDGLRSRIAAALHRSVSQAVPASLLAALAVGDKRGLHTPQRQRAQATGVSHLLAISGFHIGIAALAGALAMRALWWLWPRLALRWPRRNAEGLAGLFCAVLYAALAGWGLPTQRALIMITVAVLATTARRRISAPQALSLALLSVLAFDPLSVLSAGFWLSFAGVAFLLWCLAGTERGWKAWLLSLGRAQWVMTLALLPLSIIFFGQASLVGPVANVIAVPWVSLAVVPLTLLGVLALPFSPTLAALAWKAAATLMGILWQWLGLLAAQPLAQVYLPSPPWWALPLALIGAAWLLMPRGAPVRWLGLCLFAPLLFPHVARPAAGGFQVVVLDVGQGLSVLVRTRHHALVYDTGARFPSGYSLGERVVVPALHAMGVQRLDRIIISHGDNDHAGGAPAVHRAYPHAPIVAGEPGRLPLPAKSCHAGQRWQWDKVQFTVLWPLAHAHPRHDNDRSCVLRVLGASGQAWLTGDISRHSEAQLLGAIDPTRPGLLVVPHHGSKTSSSALFLRALSPQLSVASAGWENPYGHPAAVVVQRYAELGLPLINTARHGAVAWRAPAKGMPFVDWRWRDGHRAYWREPSPNK